MRRAAASAYVLFDLTNLVPGSLSSRVSLHYGYLYIGLLLRTYSLTYLLKCTPSEKFSADFEYAL